MTIMFLSFAVAVGLGLVGLQYLADRSPVTVRPINPADLDQPTAGLPTTTVPVSPLQHHYADGRVPDRVTGRATAASPGRHAGPGRAKRTHRIPAHAQPRIFSRSTL